MPEAKLTSKGQVTIPKEVREALHVDAGDRVQFFIRLQASVLVAQDQRCVRIHRRDDQGRWLADPDTRVGGERFELPTLETPIRVDEIYDGILDPDGRSLLR